MSGCDPSDDPAGRSGAKAPDLTSLQENFSQQQAKITALRELVRQTESAHGKKTASAQEKVKNIAQRLTQYKTKATKSRLSRASSSEVHPDLIATRINEEGDISAEDFGGVEYEEQQHMSLPLPMARGRSETPGSEKFNLLRQQMEQNRLKMAERESHKREMEEKVIELKHKLESTQQTLERSVEFGRSTGDLTMLTPMKMGRFEFNKSTSDLTQLAGIGYAASSNFDVERLKYLEGRVKVLEQELANKENIPVRDELVQDLERKILDLEEALKEKECIIEARTQAVSLMTENLTLKGKNTVDLLEDTKQEMYRMQTNFVQAESNFNAELDRLRVELDEKNSKISNMEEMNNILETARFDLTVENSNLKQKLEDVQDFSTKICELNKINQSLQHRITELENHKYEYITDAEAQQAKYSENDEKYRELLDKIEELEEELTKKLMPEQELLDRIRSLEATIEEQQLQIECKTREHSELQEVVQEKTVELNVLNANFSVLQEKLKTAGPKPLFPKSPEEEAEVETSKLKQQLDEANKNMIKSKLKIKQLQKQVDSFKKTSTVHEEVVKLSEEVQTLTQRLAEVEEEKGNLQLHLVNYDGSLPDSELEKRIKILETTCQNQNTAIQLLEEQKLDLSEDLNSSKHELEAMRDHVKELDPSDSTAGRISCQMSSIELEEKLEKCAGLQEELAIRVQQLEGEKLELQRKLDRYMVENIELLDKIEKLSLEKVSSAESIEIVEGLTPKEKQEIECYEQASMSVKAVDEVDRTSQTKGEGGVLGVEQLEPGDCEEDLNASLVKLREESSELMHKIELFTNERREVLEKLEALTQENQALYKEQDKLREDHDTLVERNGTLEVSAAEMRTCLARIEKEKEELMEQLESAKGQSSKSISLSGSSGPSSSDSSPAKTSYAVDKEAFEQMLRSVDNEVTNFNKNKDKNKKLIISKKLSVDAKNLHKMANSLLDEYCSSMEACSVMRDELAQLKLKLAGDEMETELRLELDRKNEEIDKLQHQIETARETDRSSDEEPELLKVELNIRNDEIRELKKETREAADRLNKALDEIRTLEKNLAEEKEKGDEMEQFRFKAKQHEDELAGKQETIDTLNAQIIELYKSMEENSNKIIEKDDEVQYLQELLDERNSDVKKLHNKLDESKKSYLVLQKHLDELASAPVTPAVDPAHMKELEEQNHDLSGKNKELMEKLKKFAANLKKKNAQCQELEEKLKAYQCEMEEELKKLSAAAVANTSTEELKEENEELSQKLHHLNNELHKLLQQKYHLEAERQLAQNAAADMQEKLQAAEATVQDAQSKLLQSDSQLEQRLQQFETLHSEAGAMNVKIEKCKAIIKEKNKEIQRLQEHERKTAHLEDEIKMSQSKLEDFHNQTLLLGKLRADKEEIVVTLKGESDRCKALEQEASFTVERLRKLEVGLEMAENENSNLKQQIVQLEEGISLVEQRRGSLERQKQLLGDQIEERSQEFSRHENELLHRLANLSQHDEIIENQLREKEADLAELACKLREAEHQKNTLQSTVNQKEAELAAYREVSQRATDVENDNYNLKQELSNLQSELDRVIANSKKQILEKDSEIDQLELELTNQLAKIENERKQLQENLERARDSNTDLQDELVRSQESVNSLEQLRSDLEKEITWLKMQNESLNQDSAELQELRMQIVQDQTELENLRSQCETLAQNHQCEINALRQQIADMEAIRTQLSQNQTDDQVFVQNEVIKLKAELERKEVEIAVLQQNNLQLQMAASGPSLVADPFASIQKSTSCSTHALEERIRDLENDATLKECRIQELLIEKDLAECSLSQLKDQLHVLEATVVKNEALEAQLLQKSAELEVKSKQLFETVPHGVAKGEPEPFAIGTSQFFGAPQSVTSLFDTATTESTWDWEEPVAVVEPKHQTASSAFPQQSEIEALRMEVDRLRSQNEAADRQIQELQNKITAFTDRDDEFYQLKDEIDILRAQNSSFNYDLEEKAAKVKTLAQMLQDEQIKVQRLEEQLKYKETVDQPSVASFFSDAPSQSPIFEDIVVPKKTYLCTPATSDEVEEPAFSSVKTQVQHAVPTLDHPQEEELKTLREQNEKNLLQLDEQQRKLAEMSELIDRLNAQVEDNRRQQEMMGQLNHELNSLRHHHLELQDHLNKATQQHQLQIETLVNQQRLEEEKMLSQKDRQLQQYLEEQKQLKEDLNRLRQLNETLEQDRDTFLQMQDELDILKAQNASLLQELQEKSDKVKRVAQALTESEQRLCKLEEQLAARSEPVSAASLFTVAGSAQQGDAEVVFEEIIQHRKAFVLQPQPESTAGIQLEEDCWGTEEAMLEERHQNTSSAALERRIVEKDDYIRQLEMEKERLLQEITDLKVKCGKLLKKMKEYKAISENLQRRSASLETNELDLAIQEELNLQIKTLEGKLSESKAEREKETAERESLLKRVDVLVAANERMTEMKERQDVQIEGQLCKIKELNTKLQQLEAWGDDSDHKEKEQTVVRSDTQQLDPTELRSQLDKLESEVKDLRVDNEELQALFDEERANSEILEKRVKQKDGEIQELIEKLDGLSHDSHTIKSGLETLNQQKSQEKEELSNQLSELMSKNTELTQQIEKMRTEGLFHSSEQEAELEKQIQQLRAQLQYKESEIEHLNERIQQQALEDQTESLVQEILIKNQEICSLQARIQQLEADRQEMENNLTLQITKELASSRAEEKPSPRVPELELANKELQREKQQMEQELQVLNDQVLRSLEFEDRMKATVLELDAKNIEIEALKASLEMLKQSGAAVEVAGDIRTPAAGEMDQDLTEQIQTLLKERANLEQNYRITLDQRDAHWALVVEERGAQVAESWKQHVDQREAEFSAVEKNLREEIERLQGPDFRQADDGTQQATEEVSDRDSPADSMVQKMKQALESQELEIVTLKEQLAIRSAEYARLAAQVDPFAVKHASNMVTSEPRPQPVDNDKVPRSELELALYMIYQRDMRCEELELELRNLLEERDGLQLRLSNALRQQEEFKRKFTTQTGDVSAESSDISKTTTPEKSLQQIVQESGISATATDSNLGSDLSTKLSELHSIGHVRDKRLQEEREERHRQLSLIQRDLANMPLEAAAKIAGTNIPQNESSPQQQPSASSVLINWILGKKSDS